MEISFKQNSTIAYMC